MDGIEEGEISNKYKKKGYSNNNKQEFQATTYQKAYIPEYQTNQTPNMNPYQA